MNVKLQILSMKVAPSKALLPKELSFQDVETEKTSHECQEKHSLLIVVRKIILWDQEGGNTVCFFLHFFKISCEDINKVEGWLGWHQGFMQNKETILHKKKEKEKRLYLSTMFRENLEKEGLWEKIKNINWDLLRYLLPELQYNYQSSLIIANHY